MSCHFCYNFFVKTHLSCHIIPIIYSLVCHILIPGTRAKQHYVGSCTPVIRDYICNSYSHLSEKHYSPTCDPVCSSAWIQLTALSFAVPLQMCLIWQTASLCPPQPRNPAPPLQPLTHASMWSVRTRASAWWMRGRPLAGESFLISLSKLQI